MQTRKLGKDGPEIGAIALGCMSFAGFYGAATVEESHRTLARALELGVTHLDTAKIYGEGVSEEIIGSFIKTHPNRFTIATKGGIRTAPARGFDNSAEYLRECLEGSLKRLGVDHVALYYIHRRDQSIPIEDVMETLVRFKDEGKIGAIGFSEIAPYSLERACEIHPVTAVQSEYSLWTRLPELGMIAACKRHGAAFVPFSPLARGMLSDIQPNPATFGERDLRATNPRFQEPNFTRNIERINRFKAYAHDRGLTPASLALAWVLHRGDHLIPIPGTRSVQHLEDNAKAASIKLTLSEMAEIESILPAGFAHGDRYSDSQMNGVERYC
jgi:aryl-alcohol dehydrogenase-like predicted oxidoreductase